MTGLPLLMTMRGGDESAYIPPGGWEWWSFPQCRRLSRGGGPWFRCQYTSEHALDGDEWRCSVHEGAA